MEKNSWIDKYALRYGAGSVIGAILVYCLLRVAEQKGAIPPFKFDTAWQSGTVLGILGFSFCYLASAPMLVIHASRSYYLRGKSSRWANVWSLTTVVLISLSARWALRKWYHFPESLGWISACYTFIISAQFAMWLLMRYGREAHRNFYADLCAAREKNSELVESYRTMREHGNAFCVIVLEIVLFLGLLPVATFRTSSSPESFLLDIVVCVTLWIAPGAGMWVIGTGIELEMVKHESKERDDLNNVHQW